MTDTCPPARPDPSARAVLAACLAMLAGPALAQSGTILDADRSATGPAAAWTSVNLNVDHAEGFYGDPERSSTLTTSLIVRRRTGPWAFKVNVPWVRASGLAASGGDRFTTTRQVQEGLGDVVLTAAHDLVDHDDGLLIAAGGKAKLAVGDRTQSLITSGRNDWSLFVDAFVPVGPVYAFGTLGRTKKGDPEGVDYRDPWYHTLGVSARVAPGVSVGIYRDYRQKLTRRGAPIDETTLFVDYRFDKRFKVQGYVLAGRSDASPDRGMGATIFWQF